MLFGNPQILYLGMDEMEKIFYSKNKVENNKKIATARSKARQRAKLSYCYYCKEKVSSFCNSHSVPQFCLKRIAVNGNIYYANTLIELPFLKDEQGVNEAGTFQLICRDCDNTIFQQYENPTAYQTVPSGQVLAQIALKNSLQMIFKRQNETQLYRMFKDFEGANPQLIENQLEIAALDLVEFNADFDRARKAALGNHDDWYYLCYYQKLPYTVPLAFQANITLICDFNDIVINNIYNLDPEYHTKAIHIAIFPLEHESAIILFIDSRDKRYRSFYRQLNKLPLNDQLAAINYIIFSYSENMYISKALDKQVLNNPSLMATAQKSNFVRTEHPAADALSAAISEFSLSKRNEIPNLLSPQYALT